ncbi:MAG: lysophospholipid acyltransferase family protein [Acidimicrobiia bacterium]|nr:lysophospholipid acyltransferase family protein [Acidimicrobiia bacterium]
MEVPGGFWTDEGSNLRRAVTVPAVALCAGGLAAGVPMWLPAALARDLLRAPRRLPFVRVASFALVWSWLECIGVATSGALWVLGRSDRPDAHYALQRWWVARLLDGLRVLCNVQIRVEGLDALTPGPVVVCSRHVSHADALLPAWLLGPAGMRPRYVMKRELLVDPCLDIVGNRLPNHFVERDADDVEGELAGMAAIAEGMTARDAAVIFPEGTLASPARRERALARIAETDPARAERLATLRHLLPPRHRGTEALLRGAPDADVVLVAHTGFEGLDRLLAAPEHVPLDVPVRVRLERVTRSEVPGPGGDGFASWLDEAWSAMDAWVDRTLAADAPRNPAIGTEDQETARIR